nr:MAG TPA: hypothetical protein [Inoviridae sp.]
MLSLLLFGSSGLCLFCWFLCRFWRFCISLFLFVGENIENNRTS